MKLTLIVCENFSLLVSSSGTSGIESLSTVTQGMPTPRQSGTVFCFLVLSLCMHACLIHCPPNRLWKLAHFPNTMMSCVEWKERSVPGLFHPFVRPPRAKRVTVKEVIFKCIYSAPSTHLLLPPHQTVTAACLPILSFSISPINQQITAVTAAHCFAWVNSLKWIFTGPTWEYISYYACQLCTTDPFASLKKKKNG